MGASLTSTDRGTPAASNTRLNFREKAGYARGDVGANLVSRYALDGRRLGENCSEGFLAMAAAAGLAADTKLARPLVQRFWEMPLPNGKWRYYNGMLTMLGLLQAGGRFQNFDKPSSQENHEVEMRGLR
jgi:hypothetical protein